MKALLCALLLLTTFAFGQEIGYDAFLAGYKFPQDAPALQEEKAWKAEEVAIRLADFKGKAIKLRLRLEKQGVGLEMATYKRDDLWELRTNELTIILDAKGRDFFQGLRNSKRAEKVVVVYFDPALKDFPNTVVAIGQHATTGVGGRGVFKW